MPVRQPSSSRGPRWSSESFEPTVALSNLEPNGAQQPLHVQSQKEPKRPAEEPRRQPSGPPIVVDKAQEDVGFARFLKKHTSPTHNRVTAGGRIVPMEKRDSPPKFDLTAPQCLAQTFRGPVKDLSQQSNDVMGSPLSEVDAASLVNTHSLAAGLKDGVANANAAIDVNEHKETLATAGDNPGPAFLNSLSFVSPFAGGQNSPGLNYPLMSQAGLAGFPQFPPLVWQYPNLCTTPSLTQGVFDGVEPTTRLLVSSQNCLAQAEIHFSNLDRQLKAIDRHRAMSHHDPNLAAQRYAIVEKRSEAKELVTRLVAQVEALQSLKGPLLDTMPTSGLVSSAQTFVPQTAAPLSPASSRPQTAGGSIDMPLDGDRSMLDKQVVTGRRKIIPIVAPPTTHSQPSGKEGSHRAELIARRASASGAPPSSRTLRQGEQRRHIPAQSKDQVDSLAGGKTFTTTACVQSSTNSEEPQIIRWTNGKPGPLPAGMESWTELYYDALRLPEGVITVFLLDNDVCFEVRGSRFQQPASTNMSSADVAYWNKKPTLSKAMLGELRDKAEIINDSDYGDDYLLGRTPTRAIDQPGVLNEAGSLHSDEGGVQLHAPANMQDLLEAAITVEEGRRQQAASAPQPGFPQMTSDENKNDPVTELSNKGYSSVVVQTINATVRLPPSFDGTTETKNRDAKAVLVAANKNRSPRVLHRSSPRGGA
jgi:hypothetical protein